MEKALSVSPLRFSNKKNCTKAEKCSRQDKVNTADSALIFFDQSKTMVRLVRAEKMVLSGLVFA